jgi:uncharacterized protein (DUF1501 family)
MSASRREFLKRLSALAATGAAAPLALNLSALSAASAQTASDYKALVCVFLYGGNDHANTLVPYDELSHAAYRGVRGKLGYERQLLSPTVLQAQQALPDGRQYALAPALAPLLPLFDQGELGVVLNVGPLVQPTTLRDFQGKVALPPKLFSHNDQQSIWQSLQPEGASSGWGGRMGDRLLAGNGQSIYTNLNVAGNAVFMSGQTVSQLQVNAQEEFGVQALNQPLFGSQACSQVLRDLITVPGSHLFEQELSRVTQRSLQSAVDLRRALTGVNLSTPFPADNPLAAQLRTTARLIAGRQVLDVKLKRQVFFVSLGGFDTHDGIAKKHPRLLGLVAQALTAFQAALRELGVSEQVTTFTASDFGRSLSCNTDGSDHGWGSMHFVMGGAVQGGRYVGVAPQVALNSDDDAGHGRLLPTLAVDELAASLGAWLGVSDSELLDILPNLNHFSARPRPALFRTA